MTSYFCYGLLTILLAFMVVGALCLRWYRRRYPFGRNYYTRNDYEDEIRADLTGLEHQPPEGAMDWDTGED